MERVRDIGLNVAAERQYRDQERQQSITIGTIENHKIKNVVTMSSIIGKALEKIISKVFL